MFGGDSDESEVDEIDFNPVAYFIDLMVLQMSNEECLPGDNSNSVQEMVTQDSHWYPFRNEDVCIIFCVLKINPLLFPILTITIFPCDGSICLLHFC